MGRFRSLTDNIYKLENFIDKKNKRKLLNIYKKSTSYGSGPCFKTHYLNEKQTLWIVDYLKENFIKIKNKNFTKIVTSMLEHPNKYQIIIVSYPKSQSKNKKNVEENLDMHYHYDKWSDWNIMLSIGNESIFKRPRKKNISIKSSDLVLFNGNVVKHGVSIKNGKGIGNVKRVTFQIRKKIPKFFKDEERLLKLSKL